MEIEKEKETDSLKNEADALKIETDPLKREMILRGFVVVEDLLFPEECDELTETAYDLAESFTHDTRTVFNTQKEDQLKTDYFLESNDKIAPFFEDKSLDAEGNLVVEPRYALNKIGHALHYIHPQFRCYTYCDRVKTLVKRLGFKEPSVVQSMVIFKNPNVSSEVQPHQDATFLFAEPQPVVGFWIALEDATVENGCLWVLSGSHRSGIHRRLSRNQDPTAAVKLAYDKPSPIYPISGFRPVPIRKGSCIILHGHLVHMSGINKTDKPRPAYTFHIVEKKDNIYSPVNWLQEGPAAPFEIMDNVKQIVFPDSDALESLEYQAKASTLTTEPGSHGESGSSTSEGIGCFKPIGQNQQQISGDC